MSAELSGPIKQAHNILETMELPEEMFLNWWSLLAEQDRSEFVHFYQGDTILARFVCVLDYLIMQKVQAGQENLFAMAYYIAARPFGEDAVEMGSQSCRTRSQKAWQHPAVEALIERVKFRATRQRVLRIGNLLSRNLETMLEDAHKVDDEGNPLYGMKERNLAAMASIKYMELAAREEAEIMAIRTKAGLENARKSLAAGEEEVDPKVLEGYVRLAKSILPADKLKELTA